MKKLKKSSKNKKPTFNVVIIYGTVAVGKFTVASELHKMTKYNFFHNHHTHDLARQIFEKGSPHLGRLIEDMRFLIFKEIALARINVVTTHTYSPKYVSPTGLKDPAYMKKIESIIDKNGGRACFVHLVADDKEILKRVVGESRKNFRKLKDKKTMKELLEEKIWKIPAPVKNNIQIDNTGLSPKKVANIIIKQFEL